MHFVPLAKKLFKAGKPDTACSPEHATLTAAYGGGCIIHSQWSRTGKLVCAVRGRRELKKKVILEENQL